MRRRAVIQINALALVICLTSAIAPPTPVGALDVVYDAENGWQGFQLDERLVFTSSTGDIRLRPAGNRTGAQLFVGFEPAADGDAGTQPSPYQPVSPGTYLPGRPQVGERSGLFTAQTTPLVLRPLPGSVLSPQFTNQSFTIQMWVNPNHPNSGRILSWESRNIPTPFPAQRLRFAHADDTFTWTLRGLFYNERTGAAQDVRLNAAKIPPPEGGAAAVGSPGVWQHHHLQYIHNEARVTYRVDGQVVDTVAVTAGSFPAHWRIHPGSAGDLHVGGGGASVAGFSGRIDHLLIHAGEIKPVLQRYPLQAGEVRSETLDLGPEVAGALQRITIESAQPSHTQVLVWYRFSQQASQLRDDTTLPWLPVTSGAGIVPAPLGRYVHLRAKLYPDGPGNFSPTLSSITLSVDPVRPALPALSPEATAADEVLTVSWDPAPELRTIHYRVLYGTDPGVYPFVVDVQDGLQTTLVQLENEQVYYISIESYLPGFPTLPGGRTEPIIGRVFLEAGNQ